MKRQQLRKTLIFISALVFPITFFYYSPYVIIHAAIEGIVGGSCILFAGMLVFSIFFGRLFCGYICAGAGFGEMAGCINKKGAKLGKYRWIKYIIWVIWLMLVIFMFIKSGGIKAMDPLYGTKYGISLSAVEEFPVYYGVVIILFGMPLLFGKRAFCHYICWMAPFMNIGMKIRSFLHLPGVRMNMNKTKCIKCKKCNASCPMGLDVEAMVQAEKMCESECSMCGACIDSCPKKVITYEVKSNKK